ncbi:MAG: hypothetical protein AAGC45_11335, partial [Bacteroidota bacterium]
VALVGLFSWSINNIIDQARLSPILEYGFTNDGLSGQLEITNISSKSKLSNLLINVCSIDTVSSGKFRFSNPIIKAIPPAYLLESKIDSNSVATKCFDLFIKEIQPNGKFVINYQIIEDTNGILKLKRSGNQTVRLVRRNFMTFGIKNQITLNIIIFGLCIILIIPYLVLLIKNP